MHLIFFLIKMINIIYIFTDFLYLFSKHEFFFQNLQENKSKIECSKLIKKNLSIKLKTVFIRHNLVGKFK